MIPDPPAGWLRLDALMIGMITACLFTAAAGNAPLAGTEGHRVIPAIHMVETGQWGVPRLWGVQYLAKPPLHPWTLALTHLVTGSTSAFVMRLPSVIAAGALAALLCIVGNRWFRRPAGLIAGASMLALIALWHQSVKADIDGAHTFTAVATTLGLLHLGTRRDSTRLPVILTGLAFGAMLLHKGPAAATMVAGAMLAPMLVGAPRGAWRRPSIGLALLIGGLLFAAWAVAAYILTRETPAGGDQSGVNEVLSRMARGRGESANVLLLPFVLMASALPLSAVLPWGWARRTAQLAVPAGGDVDLAQLRLRALIVTIALTILFAMIANLVNPRYSYFAYPLMCLVAGPVIIAWLGRSYRDVDRLRLRQIGTVTAGIIAGAHFALWYALRADGAPPHEVVGVRAMIGVVLGLAAIVMFMRLDSCRGLIIVWLGFASALPLYGLVATYDRWKLTNARFAPLVAEHVGESPVLSDAWVITSPELFWYADVDVRYVRDTLRLPTMLSTSSWMLLHPREWSHWSAAYPGCFVETHEFTINNQTPVLARFVPTAEVAADTR